MNAAGPSVMDDPFSLGYVLTMRKLMLPIVSCVGLVGFVGAVAAAPTGKAHPPTSIGSPGEWFGPDMYPADARAAGEQGRVAARVTVDASGKPVSCAVVGSSGSFALDSGTCAIAMSHAFTPATDDSGTAITGAFTFAVRWVIPKEPVEPVSKDAPAPATRDQ